MFTQTPKPARLQDRPFPDMLCAAMTITRRKALEQLSAGALLALGLWPGAVQAREKISGKFRFIVANDIHYMTAECGRFLTGVVRQMKAERPEFCLLAGDLTERGQREHLAAVRAIFAKMGCPIYAVIGNHDYDAPTSNRYYKLFFPHRLNYWFEHRGWQFVGLDTSEGQKYEKTQVQPATLAWLDTHLKKLDPRRPTVIFTHFPLGPGVKYRPLNADAVLEKFKSFNMQGIYCGHFHGFTEKPVAGAIAYTNRCCALKRGNHDNTKEKGYLLCTAADGRVSMQFVPVEVPKVTNPG